MDVLRAWKDPVYRSGLDQAKLPSHPAGVVDLTDDQLNSVDGGTTTWLCATAGVVTATATVCSPSGTLCGSCSHGSSGCC
ncbi:mersacidin/lichenicidin family type 2 lantibiotic [Nonomuraea mesophila]|uniref:Mersacidin/lichenicidin family type 2 lantibiotic n=1 Tax=Nonomuraea mesophila TaxID=2530382 RepID=A0A4R5F1I0_9ACTN|nr:mersacidin/lichenicidin family type 2 lantibiotic [Nonomuraea mesophila]TDE41378.1 mersacidin/lichenicidin family type 2 lantibiotic [Nonomuraea mesophila]